MSLVNANCYFGDHEWRGGVCIVCDERFRCACGCFMRVENLDAHVDSCPFVVASLRAAETLEGEP